MNTSLLTTSLLITTVTVVMASSAIQAGEQDSDCNIAYADLKLESQVTEEVQAEQPLQPDYSDYLIEVNSDGSIPRAPQRLYM